MQQKTYRNYIEDTDEIKIKTFTNNTLLRSTEHWAVELQRESETILSSS